MFRTVSIVAFVCMVAALGVYHVVLRVRHISHEKEPREVHRFGLFERCVHALAILSLIILAVTGFVSVILYGGPMRGGLWLTHFAVAPVFALAVAVIGLIWLEDGRFEEHDWQWVRHLGGYIWKRHDLPADRFNAGQKAYFWFVGLCSILVVLSGVGRMCPIFGAAGQAAVLGVHRYTGLALVLAVMAHFYLGTLANPGTLWAMITGHVGSSWAKRHHPLWWERISRGGKEGHDK
jgi:formate dehydrogenase subunit gamma